MRPIGILGGGQLARMLALAGHPLGLEFRVLEPSTAAPAAVVADHVCGALDDPEVLARFADGLDVVTCEIEHLPDLALELEDKRDGLALRPGARAIRTARDRLEEKTFVRDCRIATADFISVDTHADVALAQEKLGFPFILKTRTHGYDGRGQAVVRDAEEAAEAFDELSPAPLLAESFVPFERELSVIVARSTSGELAHYPVVQNHHAEGILRWTLAPAPNASDAIRKRAEEIATTLATALDYVGVLTIELFQVGDELLVNEMAPRVHNSGHWTIEGAETSQFENHLRAILGLPLGKTAATDGWVMFNLLGELPDTQRTLEIPGAHLHLYGKAPRPGRKLGHVTIRAAEPATERTALQARLGLS